MGAVLCERLVDRVPGPVAGAAREKRLRCLVDLGGPCNFSCASCPRPGSQLAIPERCAGAVSSQVLERARAMGATGISAGFYGGEPLLRPELLRAFALRLRQTARSGGLAFEGACLTNGSLLDERAASLLKSSGIDTVQVTLAGPGATHDQLRRSRAGEPTFARILQGLRSARNQLRVVVRVETLGLEREEIDDLFDSLDDAGILGAPGVSVYWAPPAPYEEQLRGLWQALAAAPITSA